MQLDYLLEVYGHWCGHSTDSPLPAASCTCFKNRLAKTPNPAPSPRFGRSGVLIGRCPVPCALQRRRPDLPGPRAGGCPGGPAGLRVAVWRGGRPNRFQVGPPRLEKVETHLCLCVLNSLPCLSSDEEEYYDEEDEDIEEGEEEPEEEEPEAPEGAGSEWAHIYRKGEQASPISTTWVPPPRLSRAPSSSCRWGFRVVEMHD